jgi:hypothetical protein
MANVSQPEIVAGEDSSLLNHPYRPPANLIAKLTAYEDVRANKSDTNWLVIQYEVSGAF